MTRQRYRIVWKDENYVAIFRHMPQAGIGGRYHQTSYKCNFQTHLIFKYKS